MECTLLTDVSPKSIQPTDINIQLKNHQLTLLNYCRKLEESSKNTITVPGETTFKTTMGVIGDLVGSGKTLSVLSVIADNPILENHIPVMYNNSYMSFENIQPISNITYAPYNIIVIPHTIFLQWKETLEKYTSIQFFGINNKKSMQKFMEIFNNDKNDDSYKNFVDNKIILLSSTKYNEFSNLWLKHWKTENMKFSRVIFDEADSIKIPACNRIMSSFIWFVTSSYKVLLKPYGNVGYVDSNGSINSYYDYDQGYITRVYTNGLRSTGFIRNTMIELSRNEQYIKHIFVKNCEDFVKTSFSLPDYISNVIKCKMPYYLKVLNNNISQDIINHINAGDIKGAIEKFDCTTATDENELIKTVTKDFQQKLDNKFIELDMKSKMTYSSKKVKDEALLKIKLKIKYYKSKIQSIQDKLKESDVCVICYGDEIINTAVAPCCNTKYCCECISKWLVEKKQCPFCRHPLNYNSLIVVCDKIQKTVEKELLVSKINNLKKIITERSAEPDFKMLIFSDFSNSFINIIDVLNEFNINYSQIMGHTNTINRTLERFKSVESNTDKIDVLLLNTQFCASGINLENSTDIVIYHSMDKDKTTQVIGRGQRPGRRSPLNVWNLCYENEL